MNKLIFVSILSINLQVNGFECYSENPELSDSSYWASSAIDLFAKKEYEKSIKIVNSCLKKFLPEAIKMENNLKLNKVDFPPAGRVNSKEKLKIQKNYAVNDVSMALWTKARALEEIKEIELAKNTYAQCITLSYGRAWDPKGLFWAPAYDCLERARKLLN